MRKILIGVSAAAMVAMASMAVNAEGTIKTSDGLLEIALPEGNWYQIISDENTEMFSDGDCAIIVNLYKNGDTLPAIQSADAEHELIYTAAASTQQYVLHVVGYAHEQADFSGICKAINTIKLDNSKIADSMLNHTLKVDNYSVADMNYTAWVASDGLNVRSTSEDGSIITTLERGDEITVLGTVIHNGVEIGWAYIKTADGTTGYVSTQFLTTTATSKSEETTVEVKDDAKQSGETCTLYDESAVPYTMYRWTDGTWRTDSGIAFWLTTSGNYISEDGFVLYVNKPDTGIYRTGDCYTLFNDLGTAFTVYAYSDGNIYDDSFNTYERVWCSSEWLVNGGSYSVYDVNPVIEQDEEAKSADGILLENEDGEVVSATYIVEQDAWYEDDGENIFYRYNPWGAYATADGEIYHVIE